MLRFNLKLAVEQPTRPRSQTCIDNIAHNFKKKCKTEIIEFALSDHTAQLIHFPVKNKCTLKYWRKKQREYTKDNINKFKDCLKSLSFSDIYETRDANVAYNLFIQQFKLFYNLCFPFRYVTVRVDKKPNWISKGIKMCSKKKRSLLWIYRRNRTLVNRHKYIEYAKIYKKIIMLTKRAQNCFKIKTSTNKCKSTWQIINKSKFNTPKDTVEQLEINNKIITKPLIIANEFNKYFVDKVVPIPNTNNKNSINITNRTNSMFMAPSLPTDILNIIKGLKNTSSVGLDEIDTKIIKSVASLICEHLSYILNLCISNGIFPEMLKISIVKPLHKKDAKELMSNYRPIALISIISKIFEKYIYNQIYQYLEKNKILCNEQKGFRQNMSINLAIFDFLRNIMLKVDKCTPVCSVLCDMTQAFDYVDHKTLIDKLERYGIRGNILKLINSYLSNRKQVTAITKLDTNTNKPAKYMFGQKIR
ncbi:uncharacterized protein LOC124632034 [Helicoverpa zea]|uniref:uncharacterized protein LOC124632034 n=1 Tax=Helicoverpa zea TaxID=7113 RepID=UPI001F56DF1A|nr:uncharacterized protein LOC124632034 [Helicoverpa zea]